MKKVKLNKKQLAIVRESWSQRQMAQTLFFTREVEIQERMNKILSGMGFKIRLSFISNDYSEGVGADSFDDRKIFDFLEVEDLECVKQVVYKTTGRASGNKMA